MAQDKLFTLHSASPVLNFWGKIWFSDISPLTHNYTQLSCCSQALLIFVGTILPHVHLGFGAVFDNTNLTFQESWLAQMWHCTDCAFHHKTLKTNLSGDTLWKGGWSSGKCQRGHPQISIRDTLRGPRDVAELVYNACTSYVAFHLE